MMLEFIPDTDDEFAGIVCGERDKPNRARIEWAIDAFGELSGKPARFAYVHEHERYPRTVDGVKVIPHNRVPRNVIILGAKEWTDE